MIRLRSTSQTRGQQLRSASTKWTDKETRKLYADREIAVKIMLS